MRQIGALLRKDLLTELRSPGTLVSMVLFGFLVVLVFSFATDPGQAASEGMRPGVFWVAFVFSGTLGLGRTFGVERDNDCYQGLILCPVDRSILYLGKVCSTFLFTLLTGVLVFLFFSLLYGVASWAALGAMGGLLLLASLGFAVVGTLFSGLALALRNRDLVLPVMLFPVLVPLVLAAAKATQPALAGEWFAGAGSWLLLLVLYDVVFLGIAVLTFEYVVEE